MSLVNLIDNVYMTFYELIFIIRQDVSTVEVDKIANDLTKIVEEYKGEVIKTEYWGLRTLAYEINNNKKGHYYFMGISANNELTKELGRKIKLSESIIRSSLVKVQAISKEPSPPLRGKKSDSEVAIDVTIEKNIQTN